ncbi:Arc family DNA-binding protein [Rhizobium acaciae]|uniref:Arc family DNA-binding protein n=1 Tax=Rhizobium acaciae TaxID=2989736 RepID=UPI0038733FBD
MRDLIRKASEENGRSMNVEIIHRLQTSFAPNSVCDELLSAVDVLRALTGSVVEVTERDGVQHITFQRPLPEKRD